MDIDTAGENFVIKWEGSIGHVYRDVAGIPTGGVGHRILPSEAGAFPVGTPVSAEQVRTWLEHDVQACVQALQARIPIDLTQNQFNALVSFGFNCGVGVYSNSHVATAVLAGQFDQVPAHLLEWDKCVINGVKQVNPGLRNRRQAEGALFASAEDSPPTDQSEHLAFQASQVHLNSKLASGYSSAGTC